eukprot:scpid92929/ scgid32019/ 
MIMCSSMNPLWSVVSYIYVPGALAPQVSVLFIRPSFALRRRLVGSPGTCTSSKIPSSRSAGLTAAVVTFPMSKLLDRLSTCVRHVFVGVVLSWTCCTSRQGTVQLRNTLLAGLGRDKAKRGIH